MARDAARRRGRITTRLSGAHDVWIGALLIVATIAIYAPVRHHQFLNYDDDEYVTDNAAVRAGLTPASVVWAFTSTHSATWHPLTGLSHMLDVELFGLRAGAHLLVNVLLHTTAALLLFHVLRTMTGARWPSAWVAALFALHPLHVESVAWVSERKDVLSAVFWMLTMWSYVRYVRVPTRARYCQLVAVFALGLMAKPMLVTLPFVLLLLDVWPLRRWPRLVEKLPLMALAAAVSAVTFVVQNRAGAVVPLAAAPLGLRLANALVAYVSYLRKTLWPTDLAVFYPLAPVPVWRAGLAAMVLLAVSAAVLRERRRRPYLLVGWLWYLGTLVPVIGLVRQGEQAMADRFTYLPHVGLFIMLAWSAAELLAHRRRLLAIAGAATVAACALVTARQLAYWEDSDALFRHALAVTDGNYIAHTNLGVTSAARGARDEARRHYEQALRLQPGYAKAHLNLGALLADQGDSDGAVARYAEALRLDPRLAPAEYDWGLVLAERGAFDAAILHFERALAAAPAYAKAHASLAAALAAAGRRDEAIDHYRQALRLAPDLVAAHNNLAITLEDAGRADEALPHYAEVVRLAPDDARGRYNLGALLAGRGRLADAAAQYREALRLRPDAPEPAVALAWILATAPDAALRDGAEAVALAERARAGKSGDDPRVLDTLAAAYAAVGRTRDAVTVAERALARAHAAGDTALAADIEIRLRRYRES